MRSERFLLLLSLALTVLFCQGWGFAVHRHIHRSAVDALPPPLHDWFEIETEWLSAHAVDADRRKAKVPKEAPKHYLDLDAPALSCLDVSKGLPSFDCAAEACTEDTLWSYGVLPWNIQWTYNRLTRAFMEKDKAQILQAASDLGHYVSDAHVPLHTSLNYNGQLTGQDGIHGLWETRLPELFGDRYWLVADAPKYVSDVSEWSWNVVLESHSCVDSVLSLERELVAEWPGDLMVREERGRVVQKQRVPEWCGLYDQALEGMVERRWRRSIQGVASLWMSAWVDAGQPNLDALFMDGTKCGWWKRLFGPCPKSAGNG